MKKITITVILFILGGISWIVYNTNENTKENNNKVRQMLLSVVSQQPSKKEPDKEPREDEAKNTQTDSQAYSDWSDVPSQEASPFPLPVLEKIGSITQRTIHIGVRKWEWVPVKITANYGERIILIMHNADVKHSISIPELDVRQDIPEDGAVVQFTAAKRGTFTFFCDTPCGEGHNRMKGEITIT